MFPYPESECVTVYCMGGNFRQEKFLPISPMPVVSEIFLAKVFALWKKLSH